MHIAWVYWMPPGLSEGVFPVVEDWRDDTSLAYFYGRGGQFFSLKGHAGF